MIHKAKSLHNKKRIKVFYLNNNTSSILSHTVKGLNDRGEKIRAKGLVTGFHKFHTIAPSITFIKSVSRKHPLYLFYLLKKYCCFLYYIIWADAIHWIWDNDFAFDLDLKLVRLLKKPAVIEWFGSEIRIPEIEFRDNPYYKKAFYEGYEYAKAESYRNSYKIQEKFHRYRFKAITNPAMQFYLLPEFFKGRNYVLNTRYNVLEYEPQYPSPLTKKCIMVHAPSAPVCKGTKYVQQTIAELNEIYDIEFILIQNLPRAQALEAIQKADIFIDQLILGQYGMASVEAMALGKPVVCYMKERVLQEYPAEFPVINANPDTLKETLETYLANPHKRYEAGMASRKFAEVHHDTRALEGQMYAIYQDLINTAKR